MLYDLHCICDKYHASGVGAVRNVNGRRVTMDAICYEAVEKVPVMCVVMVECERAHGCTRVCTWG